MASIKQNHVAIPVTLPDFRNMGVQLRILVLVNSMAVVAAVVRSDTLTLAWPALLQLSAAIQPVLLSALVCLFVLNRPLAKLPYRLGNCGGKRAAAKVEIDQQRTRRDGGKKPTATQ